MRHLIVGYHGTTLENAKRLNSGVFDLSKSSATGWLGPGLYFWEQDISKARWWNRTKRPDAPSAILQAQIDLTENIIDFTLMAEVQNFQDFITRVHSIPKLFKALTKRAQNRSYDDAVWLNAYARTLGVVHGYRAVVLRGARAYNQKSVKSLTFKNLSTERDAGTYSRIVTEISLVVALRSSEPILQTKVIS